MGNIQTYLHTDYDIDKIVERTKDIWVDPMESTEFSEDSPSSDIPRYFISEIHRFRLPCGKIEQYSELQDHQEFGKVFRNIDGTWGTGPYTEWESMIVDSNATDYKYLKPYCKDENGDFYKNDDGTLSVCKNCEAYAEWEQYGDVMIRTTPCTNCINQDVYIKAYNIQQCWKKYKKRTVTLKFKLNDKYFAIHPC